MAVNVFTSRLDAAMSPIIDDSSASLGGPWSTFATLGYPNSGPFRYASAGSGASTATYSFTGLTPGNYKVYATWVQNTGRATNVPFSISAGGSPVNLTVSQLAAPVADATDSGRPFQLLTTITVVGTTLTVSFSNNANGVVIADAIGIEMVGTGTTTGGTTTGGTTTGTTTGGTTTGGTTTGGSTTGGTTTGSSTTGGTTAGGTTGGGTTSGSSTGGSTTGSASSTTGGSTGGSSTRITLMPGDPGYAAALASGQYQVVGYGAYVDLPSYDAGGALQSYLPAGYSPPVGAPVPQFGGTWNVNSGLPQTAGEPGTFDTWSASYETQGNDGLDNDGNGIIDDENAKAMNTAAPYPGQLRGLQIKIRTYDPSSGTVREIVVRQTPR